MSQPKDTLATLNAVEHRLSDDGRGCVCGKTWAVMINVEGRPMAAEAHSSGRSISALFPDSVRAFYHIYLSRRGHEDVPISYEYPHVLMLEEGDDFWAIPSATW